MMNFALPNSDQRVPIYGTVYGIALHATEHPVAGGNETTPVPSSPVLFIKPRNTFLSNGGTIRIPKTMPAVEVSATLAIVFGRDTRGVSASDALANVTAYTLAIDVAEPGAGFFRPPIREKCRDGFLPVATSLVPVDQIASLNDVRVSLNIDGKEVEWIVVGDLIESISRSIEGISMFMTLREGDFLLVARTKSIEAQAGSRIGAAAAGFENLECLLEFEEEHEE